MMENKPTNSSFLTEFRDTWPIPAFRCEKHGVLVRVETRPVPNKRLSCPLCLPANHYPPIGGA